MKTKKLSSLLELFVTVCILIMLISIAALSGMFWTLSNTNARERCLTDVQNVRDRAEAAISATVSQLTMVGYSEDMIGYMKADPGQAYEQQDYVRTTFESLRLLNEPLLDIYLCFGDGHVLYTISAAQDNPYGSYDVFLKACDYFAKEAARQTAFSPCWPLSNGGDYAFAIRVPIYDFATRSERGYRVGEIIALYSTAHLCQAQEGFPVEVTDAQGQRIYSDGAVAGREEAEPAARFSAAGYEMMSAGLEEMGWQFEGGYESTGVTHEFAILLRGMLLVAVIASLVLTLLSLMIYRSILDPVRSMAQQIGDIESSNTRIESVPSQRNELMVLTDGINGMLLRVNNLTQQIIMHEQTLARAELSRMSEKILLLQSQINPHFLYNNLECIRGMVAMGKSQEILKMTTRMAAIYRYCVKDESLATLKEELDNLRDYAAIIDLRYFSAYSLRIDVPEALLDRCVPRMILQPLAENAVLHGMKAGRRTKGTVRVAAASEDGVLTISFSDNGCGIPPERMTELNAEFERANASTAIASSGKIGLHNINLRLKVLFGEGSGVKLLPEPSGGTVVELRIQEKTWDAGPGK